MRGISPATTWRTKRNHPALPPPRPQTRGARGKVAQAWLLHTMLAAMLCATAGLGMLGIAPVRELFVAGAVGLGWWAWRISPSRHVEVAIVLFALAPLLRRIVDAQAGYEPSGLMLTAPLLVIALPALDGVAFLDRRQSRADFAPFVLAGACIAYGGLLGLLNNDLSATLANGLKWSAPLVYGMRLLDSARHNQQLQAAATRAFAIVLPPISIYAIAQWFNPPVWDRYWMIHSMMWSIGLPEPFKIRVFGTMNSPASFATYAAVGLLFLAFSSRLWTRLLLALPVSMALLLTLYRTAWIALIAGMLFCFLFRGTRRRAGLIAVVLTLAVSASALTGPFEQVVMNRLETLDRGMSNDVSAEERLGELSTIYADADEMGVGRGLGALSGVTLTTMPVDGMPVACLLSMGLAVGTSCLIAIIWAAGRAIVCSSKAGTMSAIVLGGQVVGFLTQFPLASIVSGELGFLFWLVVALGTVQSPQRAASLRRPAALELGRQGG